MSEKTITPHTTRRIHAGGFLRLCRFGARPLVLPVHYGEVTEPVQIAIADGPATRYEKEWADSARSASFFSVLSQRRAVRFHRDYIAQAAMGFGFFGDTAKGWTMSARVHVCAYELDEFREVPGPHSIRNMIHQMKGAGVPAPILDMVCDIGRRPFYVARVDVVNATPWVYTVRLPDEPPETPGRTSQRGTTPHPGQIPEG